MADLDQLNIQIKASATSADKAISNLERNIGRLNKSLQGIKTTNLANLGLGIKSVGDGMQAFKGVGPKKFEQIAEGINKLASVPSKNMKDLANGLIPLGVAMQTFNNVDGKGLNRTINSMTRLTTAMSGGVDTSQFAKLGQSITSMAVALQSAPTVSRSITSLMGAIAKLGTTSGGNVSAVATALPNMGKAILKLSTSLAFAPVVKAEVTQLVSAIGQLASAGTKAETTAKYLPDLGNSVKDLMRNLQTAPEVSERTVRLITALGQLAQAGSRTSRVFNAIGNMGGRTTSVFSRMRNSLDKLTNSFNRTSRSSKGFVSAIGMFYAKAWIAIRAIKSLGKSLETSMDYIETFNYFQSAWGQVSSQADLSEWKKLGYKSADEYANSFMERSKQAVKKLSGFTIADNGMLKDTASKSLGIDPDLAENYQALFGQMGSSMGIASEYANKLATSLEYIGLDLASVKNMDFNQTLDDMSSGMVGMARTWDKYGTNIRIANMDTYLAEHGINATSKALSQADKALLRTTILLDSSRFAWGDLANTINQQANSWRLFKQEVNAISRSLGNLFMPLVAKLLPYLNAMAIVVRRLLDGLGQLMGINPMANANPSKGISDQVGDYLDSVEDADDAQKKAAKSAKEWKNQLLGFDEINKLEAPDDSSSNKAKGNNTTPTADIQSLFDDVYDEYMKVWNKAFDNMEQDAQKMANRLQKALVDAWRMADGKKLGEAIAKWLNKGLNFTNKNVGKFGAGAKRLTTILGTTVNGFVEKYNWKGLGKAVGNSIGATLNAFTNFFDTVDWKNLGKSLSDSVNSFVSTGVIEDYFTFIATRIKSIIEFSFGAITNFNFKALGTSIGKGINDMFTKLSEKDKNGISGWEKLGDSIGKGVVGLVDVVANAISQIDWIQALGGIGQAFWKALKDVIVDYGKKFKKKPLQTAIATIIGVALAQAYFAKKIFFLCSPEMKKAIGNALLKGIKSVNVRALAQPIASLATKVGTLLTTTLTGQVALCIGTAVAGWKIGNWIYDNIPTDVNGDNIIDKIVEVTGLGKLATKIADFFEFELPNMETKIQNWVNQVKQGIVKHMPDWLKKLLGVDESTGKTGGGGHSFEVNVNANTEEANKKIKTFTTTKRSTTVDTKADTKDAKNDIKGVTDKSYKAKIGIDTTDSKGKVASIKSIVSEWQKDLNQSTMTAKVKLDSGYYEMKTVTDKKSSNYGYTYLTPKKADGGVLKNGKWSSISKYASGGMPENNGQLFIAREAGPELVGNLGNHTAVMNNDQIVSSVSKGVQVAVANVMAGATKQIVSAINRSGSGDMYIDGDKVTKAVLTSASRISSATGRNVFMTV